MVKISLIFGANGAFLGFVAGESKKDGGNFLHSEITFLCTSKPLVYLFSFFLSHLFIYLSLPRFFPGINLPRCI
jgi:hypothetical protein